MATSKILIDGVGIDLTNDTVNAGVLLEGYTAHTASGTVVRGTYVPPLGYPIEISTAFEMEQLLVEGNVGKVYKFVGPTDIVYTNGELYEAVSDE